MLTHLNVKIRCFKLWPLNDTEIFVPIVTAIDNFELYGFFPLFYCQFVSKPVHNVATSFEKLGSTVKCATNLTITELFNLTLYAVLEKLHCDFSMKNAFCILFNATSTLEILKRIYSERLFIKKNTNF